jgi:hypothetical protein
MLGAFLMVRSPVMERTPSMLMAPDALVEMATFPV